MLGHPITTRGRRTMEAQVALPLQSDEFWWNAMTTFTDKKLLAVSKRSKDGKTIHQNGKPAPDPSGNGTTRT